MIDLSEHHCFMVVLSNAFCLGLNPTEFSRRSGTTLFIQLRIPRLGVFQCYFVTSTHSRGFNVRD